MIYVILQYMKCTVFSSGHRENVVTIYNHVQMLVSTIHHDMFPCFLLNWKARPDVWTWAKDNPPWEDVPTSERGHETQVGLLPFLTGFLEAFDGWIGTGCTKPHRILRKAPFSHWWTSSSNLHSYYITIITILIYIFRSNFTISINSYQVPFQKTLKFSSFQVSMMSIPPRVFLLHTSPGVEVRIAGYKPCFFWVWYIYIYIYIANWGIICYLPPIEGNQTQPLKASSGQWGFTTPALFQLVYIYQLKINVYPHQEHSCLNFNTGFRNYKVHLNKGTNKTKNHWFLLDLGSCRV